MRIADIAIVSLVAFFVLVPKGSWQVEPYERWDPATQRTAFDLEETLARKPDDREAAVALAGRYTIEMGHPDWALAMLGPVRADDTSWRVQAALAAAHAQRFEWTDAVDAARLARTACSGSGCSQEMAARLDLYLEGLESAARSGATEMGPALEKAARHARPQVWVAP